MDFEKGGENHFRLLYFSCCFTFDNNTGILFLSLSDCSAYLAFTTAFFNGTGCPTWLSWCRRDCKSYIYVVVAYLDFRVTDCSDLIYSRKTHHHHCKSHQLWLWRLPLYLSYYILPTLFKNVVFEFWHFPPIFVLLKLTCLVTLFDRSFRFSKSRKNGDHFWHF